MKKLDRNLQGHLFICTNKKEKGACCFPKGGENLQKQLKEWIKSDPQLSQKLKVSKSGCLSHCEEGITAVLYSSNQEGQLGQWFTQVGEQDGEELKKLLLSCLK